ncbi:MAG: hypothetical protein WD342_09300 [Verrucomicrobiales bacterium]
MKSPTLSALFAIFLSVFVLCPAGSSQSDDARTFTSTDGKNLTANVVAVFGQTSVLSVQGREYAIPFSRLNESDQAYLKKWAGENANGATSLFDITLEAKMENKKKKEGPNTTVEEEKWVYEISVANKLPESFSGVRLECAVLVHHAHSGPNEEKQIFQSVNALDHSISQGKEPAQLKIGPVNIHKSKDSRGKRREDELIGIWVRLLQNDRIIAEKKTDAKELVEAKWPF